MRLRSVKQKFAAVFAFVFLFTSVPALSVPVSAAGATADSLSKNTGTRHVTCTALSTQALAYYTGNNTYDKLILLDGTKTTSSAAAIGSDLFNRLKSMMQPSSTISYSSLLDYFEKTDTSAGSTHAYLFYSDEELTSLSSTNREHVWPKSHGNFYESGAGSDLHHLRPANQTINSTRGNYTMGNVKSKLSNYSTKGYGNKTVLWYSSSYSTNGCDGLVEVADDIKGDVARIFLYVYVTYGSSTTNQNLFTTVSASGSGNNANDGKKVIESLATLLEWNAIDPVDEWEMKRNDLAEQVQGNRNVFIDYPELAWYLFGVEDELPEMETPSGNAMGDRYTVTASSSNTAWGTVSVSGNAITASPKGGYFVSGYEVVSGTADVTRNGNSFRVVPSSDCSIRILFSPMTLVTVTYMANGGEYDHEQAYAGETILLPQAAELTVPDGWTFAGWVDSEVARTDEKPAVIHESEYTVTGDTVLYALFSQTEAGTGTGEWTKLTSMDDFAAGTEIVFASNAYNAVAGGLMNGKVLQKVDATFSTDADKTYLEELPDGAMVFTVGGSASGWTFTSEAGQLYANAVKELNFSQNGTGTWTVSVSNGTATVTCTDTTKESMKYNSGSPRFTTYAANSNQKEIQIYFLDGSGGTPYYATSTDSGSGTEHQHEVSLWTSDNDGSHHGTCTAAGCDAPNNVVTEACSFGAWNVTQEANCTNAGSRTRTCTKCGYSETESIPANGVHSYVNGVCEYCGAADPTNPTDPYAGSWVIAAKVGNTYYAMSSTFASKINGTVITVENGKVSTTDAVGYTVTIAKTGDHYTVSNGNAYLSGGSNTNFSTSGNASGAALWTISAGTNGSYRILNASTTTRAIVYQAGSVQKFGFYAVSNVTSGSTTYYDVELLPIGGHVHSYTAEITTAATCTTDGVKTYTCSCGDSYTEVIPATGLHIDGDDADTLCDVCGLDVHSDQAKVDAAYSLGAGEETSEAWTLTGRVTEIVTPYDSGYENITVNIVIEGRENKPIEGFRIKGDAARFIAVGSTITVNGKLTNYQGNTIEFKSGSTITAAEYFFGRNVTLHENLSCGLFTGFNAEDNSDAKIVVTMNGVSSEIPASEAAKQADGSFRFNFNGLLPAEVNNEITAVLQDGSGNELDSVTFTLKTYLESLRDKASIDGYSAGKKAALNTLITDLLAYSAAAQVKFPTQVEDGKTFTATGSGRAPAGDVFNMDPVVNASNVDSVTGCFKVATVVHENTNWIRLEYFGATENVTFTIDYGTGEEAIDFYPGSKFICTKPLMPTEYATTITVRAKQSGTTFTTLTYSVNSYCVRKAASDFAVALYNYGYSAAAFVAAN